MKYDKVTRAMEKSKRSVDKAIVIEIPNQRVTVISDVFPPIKVSSIAF